jgi:hypothetical protein
MVFHRHTYKKNVTFQWVKKESSVIVTCKNSGSIIFINDKIFGGKRGHVTTQQQWNNTDGKTACNYTAAVE